MNNLEQLLTLAKGYIEQGWCQWFHAKDANEKRCDVNSPDAITWCATGAIIRATNETHFQHLTNKEKCVIANKALNALTDSIYDIYAFLYISAAKWNDQPSRTKAEVLEIYDHAIEKAKNN